MTTAFITGITGMVGSHLADYILKNTDWKVVGMSRWRSPMDNLKQHVHMLNDPKSRIRLIYGDLNDSFSLLNAVKQANPDFVFHLAAQSFPRTSFDGPLDTLQTNVIGTASLLEALKSNAPKSVIHICSSSEVFGRVPANRIPIDENESFHPASPYAISKAGTDLLGRYYAEAFGMCTLTTRMFTHTGPRRGDVFAESSFAKQIALVEAGLIPPVIKVGNLSSLRTIADVRDAVEAYYLLVTKNPIAGEYYNIGGNHTCTIGDILKHLVSLSTVSNLEIETEESRLRPIDADLQIPNTEKFQKHTGWTPKISFEKTMEDLLEYWRERTRVEGASLVR